MLLSFSLYVALVLALDRSLRIEILDSGLPIQPGTLQREDRKYNKETTRSATEARVHSSLDLVVTLSPTNEANWREQKHPTSRPGIQGHAEIETFSLQYK